MEPFITMQKLNVYNSDSFSYEELIEKHYKIGGKIISVASKAYADRIVGISSDIHTMDLTDSYNLYDYTLKIISCIIEDCTDPKKSIVRNSNKEYNIITMKMTSKVLKITTTICIDEKIGKDIPGLKESIDLLDKLYENEDSTVAVEYNNNVLEIPGNKKE